jgi:hypothetical protein
MMADDDTAARTGAYAVAMEFLVARRGDPAGLAITRCAPGHPLVKPAGQVLELHVRTA